MQRLSTTDASFLYTESVSGPMHISSTIIVEGELPFEQIVAHFESRLPRLPAYRRKLAQTPLNVAHPVWVDATDFDLSQHLIHHDLGAGSTIDEAVAESTRLNEVILDRSRPLWRVHVLTGVPDRTVLLLGTHHAMVDGASGVEMLAIIFDFDSDYESEAVVDDWEPKPEPSPLDLFSRAMSENLQALGEADFSTLWPGSERGQKLANRAARIASNFLGRPAITASFNAGIVGPGRNLAWLRVPLDEIREIRRGLSGTVNDVVLTVVSEAVSRYLADHDEPVDEGLIRIMCPVNVRTETQQGALGNQVSALFPMLPAWPMPVAKRMATVVGEMERIKSAGEAQVLTLLQQSVPEPWPVMLWPTQLVGGPLDPTAMAANLPRPTLPTGFRPPNPGLNFVCTNVPGSQVPQYLCGHKVLDQIGMLVLSGNLGLGTTITSYNRQLYFSFICEPELMPDVERLREHTADAYAELLAAAQERIAQAAR
ncbi:MAG: wax ester/triacylglycerol synthase family O-acyltransferase [Pseudomonadota bacterium]